MIDATRVMEGLWVQQGQEGDSGRGREVHDGCDSPGGMSGHLEAAQVARERCN